MKEKPSSTFELLRRALNAQVELGMGEAIVSSEFENQLTSKIKFMQDNNNRLQSDIFTSSASKSEYDSPEMHCQAICDCQRCDLAATRMNFVYGVGNPNADLMFVGEAPGADEDRLGEPFVGRAGKLLDKILTAIDLSRDEIYIANILKCRPPGNRDPQPDEMEQCFPYLHEQIRIIKPKLMCALGRIAAQALLKTTTPLGKMRVRWHQFDGVPMLVTYHPAALLRFPGYKKDTWEDMQMLKARYDEVTR